MLRNVRVLFILPILFFLSISFLSAADAGKVTGTMMLDGKTYQLKNICAVQVPNSFDEKKMDTLVVFTDQPLPKIPTRDMDAMGMIDGEKIHGFFITIDDKKEIYYFVIGSLQQSGNTAVNLETTTFTPQMIEGKITSKGPQEMLDHKFQVDATFKSPVAAAAKK